MLGGFLKVLAYEWSRHQRFQEKIREAVRMGGGFLKVLADSGLRMVPTSKVPRENLGARPLPDSCETCQNMNDLPRHLQMYAKCKFKFYIMFINMCMHA